MSIISKPVGREKHLESEISNSVFQLIIRQLRLKQWTKNFLIFAALIFSLDKINIYDIAYSIMGFFLFCFVSSCVYIINDFVDREADRNHPIKKKRPIASGMLDPYLALSFGGILLSSSIIISYFLSPIFCIILLSYFILNCMYSFKLKHVVIIDIMIIAIGFVLRAIAGGVIIDVSFTPWFLMCTMFLCLFLAIGKRRHEYNMFKFNKGAHRRVLDSYLIELLDPLMNITLTCTIISYSLFTFTSGHTIHLMWSIPLVIYGSFRYLYLIHVEGKGGAPENLLLEDKHILVTVILYIVLIISLLLFLD